MTRQTKTADIIFTEGLFSFWHVLQFRSFGKLDNVIIKLSFLQASKRRFRATSDGDVVSCRDFLCPFQRTTAVPGRALSFSDFNKNKYYHYCVAGEVFASSATLYFYTLEQLQTSA